MRIVPLLGSGILFVTVMVGCGSSGPPVVAVSGKITRNGEIMAVKPMVGRLTLSFYPVAAEGAAVVEEADLQADGTFTVPGKNGNGIPPGKYKIAVVWQDDFPTGPDKLNGKYNQKNTPLIREVQAGSPLVIDVGKDKS